MKFILCGFLFIISLVFEQYIGYADSYKYISFFESGLELKYNPSIFLVFDFFWYKYFGFLFGGFAYYLTIFLTIFIYILIFDRQARSPADTCSASFLFSLFLLHNYNNTLAVALAMGFFFLLANRFSYLSLGMHQGVLVGFLFRCAGWLTKKFQIEIVYVSGVILCFSLMIILSQFGGADLIYRPVDDPDRIESSLAALVERLIILVAFFIIFKMSPHQYFDQSRRLYFKGYVLVCFVSIGFVEQGVMADRIWYAIRFVEILFWLWTQSRSLERYLLGFLLLGSYSAHSLFLIL